MRVTVVGAGVMGPGIAVSWLRGGHQVVLIDVDPAALARATDRVEQGLRHLASQGFLREEPQAALMRLETTLDLAEAASRAGLVVECVSEDLQVKLSVYEQLEKSCPTDVPVVSNTSSLPLPEILPNFRPDRFLICHYFNPPEVIPLVELVHGGRTDPKVVRWLAEELRCCGKVPVTVKGFKPGFLVNRLQVAMMREALALVGEGVVTPADVDLAVKAAIGFKSAWQGLFETMDFIGLDTVAAACRLILPTLDDTRDVPAVVLDRVRAGDLGVKTGRGFFDYRGEKAAVVIQRRYAKLIEQLRLWNEAQEEAER